jgi:phosphatidylglycerophosphatase A
MSKIQSDKFSPVDYFRRTGIKGKMVLVLSSWFGSGFAPVAPGTFGTLAAIPLVMGFGFLGPWAAFLCVVGISALAVWVSQKAESLFAKKDPSQVVIDEVAGLSVTMFLVPLSWLSICLGFFLFRFFDILKPWPVNRAEKLPGGFGIVLDDLVAGVYAQLFLRGILAFIGL